MPAARYTPQEFQRIATKARKGDTKAVLQYAAVAFGWPEPPTCAWCDQHIENPKRGKAGLFCSDECARAGWALLKNRAPDVYEAQCPQRLRQRKVIRACKRCGKEFSTSRAIQAHNFCSATCRAEAAKVSHAPKQCHVCRRTYKPHRRDQRFCCTECYGQRHQIPSPYAVQVQCARCGRPTLKELSQLKRYPKAYCSKACATATANQARPLKVRKGYELVGPVPRTIVIAKAYSLLSDRPVPKPRIAGTCTQCGSPYVANGLWPTQSCSPRCTRRAAATARKHRKRANPKGTSKVYRAKVYARDNYACWLCNKPLRMDKQVPHPKAPTLDHVVPVALGGAHSHENIRAAHFICNSRRGQNAGQLALGW